MPTIFRLVLIAFLVSASATLQDNIVDYDHNSHWIPCTRTIDNVKQSLGDVTMLIQECVSHCKRLDNFDALYTAHGELSDILNRIDVCDESLVQE